MEVVLNDYAIDSQFPCVEDFVDSLVEYTFPALEFLRDKSSILLKSYETYSRKITEEDTIYSFLQSQKFRGFSEAQKLRNLLGALSTEPYWEEDSKTEKDATYSCEYAGTFCGEEPNCFSEALERDGVMLSLEHLNFQRDTFGIAKNEKEHILYNIYDRKSVGKNLFLNDYIGFCELLLSGVNESKVCFWANNGAYYADEYFENGKISKNDALAIKEDFDRLIDGKENGSVLSRFTDSIVHKKMTYCEFRTTLSDKREFRIFYFVDGEKWVFLNSLMKTTQTTPEHIKDRTCILIRQYKSTIEKRLGK